MLRVIRRLFRSLLEALVRLYYPVISVEGGERVPVGVPIIFVPNHPNGLLDPLLLRVALGRPVRFLGKSTLFGNPIGRLAMDAFATIPVYRTREAGAGADPSRNEETFARCRDALGRGHSLALFPEGTSHSDPQLKPLKTGAARIALSAEKEHGGKLGLVVLPVGLLYERKAHFRSRVLVVLGQPRAIAPLLPEYERDERAAVEALTEEIRVALDQVVLQAETRELLEGVARVAVWTAEAPAARDDLAEQNRRARELLSAYERLRSTDPARVEAISTAAREYARTLRGLGVEDPWALEVESVRPGRALRAVLRLVVSLPVAAIGALMGWLPYRLAGKAAERVVVEKDDILGTAKLIAGAVFLLVGWTIEAVAVGWLAGPWWGVATALAGPATGYVALLFEESMASMREALHHLWLRGVHFDRARHLADRRRALADEVARALREAA